MHTTATTVRTVSLSQLKRDAKRLKKKLGLTLGEALNKAAKNYGKENYKHFLNALDSDHVTTPIILHKIESDLVDFTYYGFGKYKKPSKKMSLENHQKVADLLLDILSRTKFRKTAYNPIDSVRSDLDEWIQKEYTSESEITPEQFHNLYYRRHVITMNKFISYEEKLLLEKNLNEVIKILGSSYPDCKPVTEMLNKLQKSKMAIFKWSEASYQSHSLGGGYLKKGTIVKQKLFGNEFAVVENHDINTGVVHLIGTATNMLNVRSEVSVIRNQPSGPFWPKRFYVPYGMGHYKDGRKCLFSRDYKVMWIMEPAGTIKKATGKETERFDAHQFTKDGLWLKPKTFKQAMHALKEWDAEGKAPQILEDFWNTFYK